MELQIEKGVPMPTNRRNNKGYTEALRKLNIGESVVLPTNIKSARVTAYAAGLSGRYAARVEKEGTRVWRTK